MIFFLMENWFVCSAGIAYPLIRALHIRLFSYHPFGVLNRYYLLPFTFYFLPSTFYLLLFTFYLLSFRFPFSVFNFQISETSTNSQWAAMPAMRPPMACAVMAFGISWR